MFPLKSSLIFRKIIGEKIDRKQPILNRLNQKNSNNSAKTNTNIKYQTLIFNRREYKSNGNSRDTEGICGNISKHKERLHLSKKMNEIRFLKTDIIDQKNENKNNFGFKNRPTIVDTIFKIEETNRRLKKNIISNKFMSKVKSQYLLNPLQEESNVSDFSDSKKE